MEAKKLDMIRIQPGGLTINVQRTGGVDFSRVTRVGAGVGSGTLHDLTEPLPAHGVDPAVLSWLQLLPVLTQRGKTRGVSPEFERRTAAEMLWCFITLNHLTSMICLENSHSRVAGKSSSTRASDSVFRIDAGVSGRFQKSKQLSLSPDLS